MASFAKLEKLIQAMDSLKQDSASEEVEALRSFFSDDCIAYMLSMREYDAPSVGPRAIVETFQETLKEGHTAERQILHQSTTEDGRTVFCEMKCVLHILGDVLDPFYETWVVTFGHDGLVKDLKKYSCRSHIVEIVQDKTGKGPYGVVEGTRGKPVGGAACCK